MSFGMKFAANISTMFTEEPNLLDRYKCATEYGFRGVECQFPYDYDVDSLVRYKESAGAEQVLINSYPGTKTWECGFALQCTDIFKSNLEKSLFLAKNLKCKHVHILADFNKASLSFEEMENVYLSNMRCAAHLCEEFNIIGVIEPLCKEVKPNYFLSSYEKALEYVKIINSRHLKLLMDIYHLQMTSGNMTNTIKAAFPEISHVQISQAPGRNEPFSSGEINYKYILSLLTELKYVGWVGLEYFPSCSTATSLDWIDQYGYKIV